MRASLSSPTNRVMGGQVTPEDLREALRDDRDAIRREFDARMTGFENTVKAEIKGLNRLLGLKLVASTGAGIGTAVGIAYMRSPNAVHSAVETLLKVVA